MSVRDRDFEKSAQAKTSILPPIAILRTNSSFSFVVTLNDGTAFVLPPGASAGVLLTDDQAGTITLNSLYQDGLVSYPIHTFYERE